MTSKKDLLRFTDAADRYTSFYQEKKITMQKVSNSDALRKFVLMRQFDKTLPIYNASALPLEINNEENNGSGAGDGDYYCGDQQQPSMSFSDLDGGAAVASTSKSNGIDGDYNQDYSDYDYDLKRKRPTPYGDRPIRTAIKRGRSSSAWKKLPSSWLENVPKPKEINDLVSSFGQMDFNDGGGSIGLDSVDSTCRPISYCDFRNEPLPNAGKINPQFLKANNTKNKNKSKSYSSSSSSSASFQDTFENSSTYLKGFEIDYIDDETETDDGRMSSEKETTEPDDEYYDPSYLYCSDEDIEQLCKALCESEMGERSEQ